MISGILQDGFATGDDENLAEALPAPPKSPFGKVGRVSAQARSCDYRAEGEGEEVVL